MKFVVLCSVASALFLTGCNNYKMLSDKKSNPITTLKPASADLPPVDLKNADSTYADQQKPAPVAAPTPAPAAPAPAQVAAAPVAAPQVQATTPTPTPAPAEGTPTTHLLPTLPTTIAKNNKPAPQTAPAPAAAPNAAPAATPAAAPATSGTAPSSQAQLSLLDMFNFRNLVNNVFPEFNVDGKTEPAKLVLNAVVPEPYKGKLSLQAKGTYEKLELVLSTVEDKKLSELKDAKVSLSGRNFFENNGYKIEAFCVGGKCEMLLVQFYKINEKMELAEYYPRLFKLVDGQYVPSEFKTQAQYQEDQKTFDQSKIVLVPQLEAYKKLLATVNSEQGQKAIVGLARNPLDGNKEIVYSDFIFDSLKVDGRKFQPQFSKVEGGTEINVSVSMEAKKVDFKQTLEAGKGVEIKGDGLKLVVAPNKDDEYYTLLLVAENYKSEIKDVKEGYVAFFCAVHTQEKNMFTACLAIPANAVLEQEGALEGNSTGVIKSEAAPAAAAAPAK